MKYPKLSEMGDGSVRLRVNPEVTIIKSREWGEYRVPGPSGREAEAYYTDDREDAIGTARAMWGDDVHVRFRSGKWPQGNPRENYDPRRAETRWGISYWIVRKRDAEQMWGPYHRVAEADAELKRIDHSEGRRSQSARIRGPYQVIDEANLRPRSNPGARQAHGVAYWGDEIREGAARALWVTSYADFVDEMRNDGKTRAEIEELGYVTAGGGDDWSEIVPIPDMEQIGAVEQASQHLMAIYAQANNQDIDDLLEKAANADGMDDDDITDEYADTFGHYLTMMALGHGVSWFDDHSTFPLKVPDIQAGMTMGGHLWFDSARTRMNPRRRR